jgi:hypothetical protein
MPCRTSIPRRLIIVLDHQEPPPTSPRIVSNRFFLALKNLTASVHSALLTGKTKLATAIAI